MFVLEGKKKERRRITSLTIFPTWRLGTVAGYGKV